MFNSSWKNQWLYGCLKKKNVSLLTLVKCLVYVLIIKKTYKHSKNYFNLFIFLFRVKPKFQKPIHFYFK